MNLFILGFISGFMFYAAINLFLFDKYLARQEAKLDRIHKAAIRK